MHRAPAHEDVLHAFSVAAQAVTRRLAVHEVLQSIVSSARSLLGADYAALGVPGEAGSFAEFVVDGISGRQWAAIGPLPRQHGLLGVMLRERQPQRLADIRADPRFEGWPTAHPEMAGFLGVPVVEGDQTLGIIDLANEQSGGEFSAADQELLEVFAAHAAIALSNARLCERSRELSMLEERARVAHELHDAVTQKLFGVRLAGETAAALVRRDPDRALQQLDEVAQLSAAALAELRAIIVDLRPVDLATDWLVTTLRNHVTALDRVSEAQVSLAVEDCVCLDTDQQDAAFRIAQEALHNALRHADAARIAVRLGKTLEVSDDGRGFDTGAAADTFGLTSMRERARAAGGRLEVRSRPGAGTTVRLEPTDG